ncbi:MULTISPECIES: DUF2808 domain-containing protein [Synechococcales]|uniref:DUF2808 domain-containing protein n=1 Tax=unclassified Synechococcus TaxID=2626047 RepID=UPI0021A46773|nr:MULTISPECIES: DUF2808 domain-containing protein [unclassified Synechococcus]
MSVLKHRPQHSPARPLRSRLRLAMAAMAGIALGTLGAGLLGASAPRSAQAQGTPGLVEFRWDNSKDYRRLYYFITDTARLKRSEYYLLLRPKDRNTAILKLSVVVPQNFDVKISPEDVQLCFMKEGGMMSRTGCKEKIPATVEISKDGRSIDIFPDRPVSDERTIGVYMNIFNPFNIGMYQFNALAQAPGDVPFAGYLGSWLIQIDPTN